MFYHYSQNNSGGSFHIDDNVAHHVIIEANSAAEADERAESIGIYFDGCSKGMDCDCCGDRWYEQWSGNGEDTPLIYGNDPKMYRDSFAEPGKPVCHIYYIDGKKETILQPVDRVFAWDYTTHMKEQAMNFENDYEPAYHDELERDWDERYEPEQEPEPQEDSYLDSWHEDQYDLGDY